MKEALFKVDNLSSIVIAMRGVSLCSYTLTVDFIISRTPTRLSSFKMTLTF
jgi:hypothetical protein